MTPKEKAKELVEKFAAYSYYSTGGSIETMAGNHLYSAKQCALIAVEEIIDALEVFGYYGAMYDDYETRMVTYTDDKLPTHYWQQVKAEIEKM